MPEKIIAAGGLIINEKDELLMIFRRGKWDLPKGKLDDDESIEQCAVREVKEETGLHDVSVVKFIGVTYHNYIDPYFESKNVVKETHWFKMFAGNDQQFTPQEEENIEKIEWLDNKNLQEKLSNSYPNIIEIIEKLKL